MEQKEETADSIKKQDAALKHMQALLAKMSARSPKLKTESAELGKSLSAEKDD